MFSTHDPQLMSHADETFAIRDGRLVEALSMMTLKIAFRNILRNRRRSTMTLLAIAVGAIGIVLFGEFVRFVTAGLETNAVEKVGHLTVFRTGYFAFGAGNPAEFGIDDYPGVVRLIREDPALAPRLNVVTPIVSLAGIAGNFDVDASKTFLGTGVVPSDRDRLSRWDEHGVSRPARGCPSPACATTTSRAAWSASAWRACSGCASALKIGDCPARPVAPRADGATLDGDLAGLAQDDRAPSPRRRRAARRRAWTCSPPPRAARPTSSACSSTAPSRRACASSTTTSSPCTSRSRRSWSTAARRPRRPASSCSSSHTADLALARDRLRALFAEHHLDLEVRDFAELQPFYKQAVGMFGAIFLFIALIMGVIVLFTVVNTMGMSVMERTTEIGSARAMGVRRAGIRRLFVTEGAILGAIGATVGGVLAQVIANLRQSRGHDLDAARTGGADPARDPDRRRRPASSRASGWRWSSRRRWRR